MMPCEENLVARVVPSNSCDNSPASPSNGTELTIFPESSFFIEKRAPALPSPAEIRTLNEATGNLRGTYFNRPSPVTIPSLGLFVKYGADVTIAEIETQVFVRERLKDHAIPIPEVFGHAQDGGQRFIYMALIEGETLQERYTNLSETDRQAVCAELRGMVATWRRVVTQDESDIYIGSIGKRPSNDLFLTHYPQEAGPFLGPNASQAFHEACHIDIPGLEPIVFTHNDLCPPNILLSHGPNPRVTAILDFGQSGWYPWYWEYCKASQVGRFDEGIFEFAHSEEWHTQYLPLVVDRTPITGNLSNLSSGSATILMIEDTEHKARRRRSVLTENNADDEGHVKRPL